MLEYPDQTLDTLNYTRVKVRGRVVNFTSDPITPKQIMRGLDSSNNRAFAHYTALSNK